MRRIDLASSSLALAEPEPLTLANLMTKSLIASMRFIPPPSATWLAEGRCDTLARHRSY
jgi:hypothetical protein